MLRIRTASSARLVARALIILFLAMGPATLLAQVETAPEAETPVPTATPAPVPSAQSSARATMRTFLEAMYDAGQGDKARMADAIACLDLSELSAARRAIESPDLAVTLKATIDRIIFVDYETIPDDPDAGAYVFERRAEGEITIAPDEFGRWTFTAETVAGLDTLFRSLEDEDIVEGVTAATTMLSPSMWIRSKMPSVLRSSLILEFWQWIGLLILVFIGVVVDRVICAILLGIIADRFKLQVQHVNRDIIRQALRPFGLLAMALIWRMGLGWLGVRADVLDVLYVAIQFVAAASAVWGFYRLVDVLSAVLTERAKQTESKFDDLLVPLLCKSLKIFIVAFGVVFVADVAHIPISGLLTGLGLGGLAFALAAQDTVSNLFGSLTVILDRPFHVGDWIVIQGGAEGTVEEVGFRSTRVRTFYNSIITVPNSNLIKAEVDNLGVRTYRRWKTMLNISYDTPPEKIEAFCEGIRELVRIHPWTRKDYYHVYLNAFGAHSLDILVYIFFKVPDWGTELRERHRLAVDIVRLAARLGVEFAYPTQTLLMKRGRDIEPNTGRLDGTDTVNDAYEHGRRTAHEVVESILGTPIAVPPPVQFSVPFREIRGEGGSE